MRAMKDSGIAWIGEIPEEWKICKIKQLADQNEENSFVDGDWIESPYIMDSGIRYLTTGNIGDGVFKEQGNGFISLRTFEKLSCKYAFPGDLIFSRLNAPYGRSCILPSDFTEYVVAVDNVILRTQEDKRYICYVSQCDGYKQAVDDEAKGTTMRRISRTNLGNIVIPLPPIQQQRRIADYLDRKCGQIDAIIARQQEVIEKLKAYKLSVITEAVTKGLNPHAPMKDSGVEWIGEIPEHWEVMKFGRCATIKSNLVAPDDYADYPQISPDSIEKNSGRIIDYKTVKEAGVISWNHLFFKGQVIYSKIRPMLNKVAIAPFDGLCSADMYPIETSNDTQFLVYLMLSDYFTSQVGLVTENRVKMPKINQNELSAIMVTIPPQSEQETISKYLSEKCASLDVAIDKKQGLIYKLNAYKKSLIYEVVTGKKEV